MKKVILGGMISLLTVSAYAEDWYGGFAFSRFDTELSAPDFGLSIDTNPNVVNLFIGRQLNKNFAVEGLVGLGLGDDKITDDFSFETSTVIGAFAVGIVPVSETFNLYAKLGLAKIDYEDSDGDTADASGISFGLGASFDASDALGFNIEYVQYPDGDYNNLDIKNNIETTALNAGVYWKF